MALGEESTKNGQIQNYLEQMKTEEENIRRSLPSFVKRKAILHSKLPSKMDIQSSTRDINGERRRMWPWVSEGYLLREMLNEVTQLSRETRAEIVTRQRRIRRLNRERDVLWKGVGQQIRIPLPKLKISQRFREAGCQGSDYGSSLVPD